MLNTIKQYAEKGLVTLGYHPTFPLVIAKYTRECQYIGHWDEITTQCRGIVFDVETGEIVARPFKKFFNIEELEWKVPNEPFELYEKVDGSLGIVFWYKNQWILTTQGSFTSDEGEVGRKMLATKDLSVLDKSVTYLLEIVYNQGVVRYDYNDLVLLGAFYTQSGVEIAPKELFNTLSGTFRTAKIFNIISSFQDIKSLNWDNEEGFVVRFASGFRCKIKFLDYIEKHKNKFQLSNKLVWEALKNGTWNDFVNIIPDEFDLWAKQVKKELEEKYQTIYNEVLLKVEQVKNLPTRKDIAFAIKDYEHKHFVFAELDKMDYYSYIWDKIKPEYEKASTNI